MSPARPSRRYLLRAVAGGTVGAVVVGVWATGPWRTSDSSPGEIGTPTSAADDGEDFETGVTSYPVSDRPRSPDLRSATLDGGNLALADLRGHVVVINVWGSWCGPCREEAPDLARLARESADRGVRFIGINTRDQLAAARAFVRDFDIPYPSLVDRDGRLLVAFDGMIPVSAVPSTVVIDPSGRIAARVIGKTTYRTLRKLVKDAAATAPPSTRTTDRATGKTGGDG